MKSDIDIRKTVCQFRAVGWWDHFLTNILPERHEVTLTSTRICELISFCQAAGTFFQCVTKCDADTR